MKMAAARWPRRAGGRREGKVSWLAQKRWTDSWGTPCWWRRVLVEEMAAGWISKAKTVPPGEVREARKRES